MIEKAKVRSRRFQEIVQSSGSAMATASARPASGSISTPCRSHDAMIQPGRSASDSRGNSTAVAAFKLDPKDVYSLALADKPSEKQLRELAEAWRPHRGAAAVLAWHSYNSSVL